MMTLQITDIRWSAPHGIDVHPRLALVRHCGQLYSYSELLLHTPFEHIRASLEAGASTPQEWWDDLLIRSPAVAHRAVELCHPQDFEVLNLYAMTAWGSA